MFGLRFVPLGPTRPADCLGPFGPVGPVLRSLRTVAVAAAVACAALAGAPASASPDQKVRLIVNYGVGGTTDRSSRLLAEAAQAILGEPIRVENLPGDKGTRGPTVLSKAPPDGYTIGVTSFSPMAVSPHLLDVAYTIDSFDYIVGHGRIRYGISVAAGSPYKTIEELVAAARKTKLTFARTSSIQDAFMRKLSERLGVEFKAVSVKSGKKAVAAAVAGDVDFTLQGPVLVAPLVREGKLRLLASASSVRWYEVPDVPTLQEAGIDVFFESYTGLAVPAGVPAERLAVLRDAFARAVKDPTFQDKMRALGVEPVGYDGAAYKVLLREGYERMGAELTKAGLR